MKDITATAIDLIKHEYLHLIADMSLARVFGHPVPDDDTRAGFCVCGNNGEAQCIGGSEDGIGCVSVVVAEAARRGGTTTDLLVNTMVSEEDVLAVMRWKADADSKVKVAAATAIGMWMHAQDIWSKMNYPVNVARGTMMVDAPALYEAVMHAPSIVTLARQLPHAAFVEAIADESLAIGTLPDVEMVGIPHADWPYRVQDVVFQ
ncbi:hypothetical protein C1J05_14910 [Sulfitobacter sp. JL08]|uniref:hypothetical protein n=1 Tax=Sulfitobacter sp. JL08 TaxID=2070369 RepID=UPI000E0AE701|nr:hypothetical protein [Sulfitobacter sp. JL08]AXI55620.1 hypothetical protein C1J05_14910 [Sulfitobacter sp. JL08]